MLTRSDMRIAAALVLSMFIHGLALMWNYGTIQKPEAGPSRKKLSFKLTARHVPKQEKETKPVLQKEIQEKIFKKQPVVHHNESRIKTKPVQSEPEPVSVPVREIPQVVQDPVVQETQLEAKPVEVQEDKSIPIIKGGKQDNMTVVMARPLYRQNPPPQYPMKARRRHLEGTVILEVMVNAEGRVEDLEIKESSGYRILDKAALSSVRNWMFEPGRRNGLRVAMTVQIPVRFKLQ